ncbi:MAG: DUF2333 family protein [Syntrophobacteraceae bacterium]
MGVLDKDTFHRSSTFLAQLCPVFVMIVIASFILFGISTGVSALQKNPLAPEGSAAADPAQPSHSPPSQEKAPVPSPPAHPPAVEKQPHTGGGEATNPPALPKAEPKLDDKHAAAPEAGHGEAHGADHVQLPEISTIAGVTFVDTLIGLLEHELKGRTLGWRPNDVLIGRFTDNINNYQLGVLEAARFTTLRLKDSLTRLGEADSYDPDLEKAANYLMNSATLWWFPSAEDSYGRAIDHLRKFKGKLERGERHFYYRRDNLIALISSYKDQSGNVNRTLVMPVGWFQADDYFYYAKGVAHVHYEMLKVCRVGFKNQLTTMHAIDIMDTILHELHIADKIDPWLILNGDYGDLFANHRANLNAPLSEAGHMLGVLAQL